MDTHKRVHASIRRTCTKSCACSLCTSAEPYVFTDTRACTHEGLQCMHACVAQFHMHWHRDVRIRRDACMLTENTRAHACFMSFYMHSHITCMIACMLGCHETTWTRTNVCMQVFVGHAPSHVHAVFVEAQSCTF